MDSNLIASLSGVKYLLTDVDDTLTSNGKLLAQTLAALYDLRDAGFVVVPVTGACAGWCDQMVRLWPVAAVIGENGAFYMQLDEQQDLSIKFWQDRHFHRVHQAQLLTMLPKVKEIAANISIAKDQHYRLADVALDYNQDGAEISYSDVEKIIDFFGEQGAHAKASSIHINVWMGDYNKVTMAQRLLAEEFNLSVEDMLHQVAYVGDAPNDEPMFDFFKHSFGVANIHHHLPKMTTWPKTVLSQPGGRGFVELAELLIASREKIVAHSDG